MISSVITSDSSLAFSVRASLLVSVGFSVDTSVTFSPEDWLEASVLPLAPPHSEMAIVSMAL